MDAAICATTVRGRRVGPGRFTRRSTVCAIDAVLAAELLAGPAWRRYPDDDRVFDFPSTRL